MENSVCVVGGCKIGNSLVQVEVVKIGKMATSRRNVRAIAGGNDRIRNVWKVGNNCFFHLKIHRACWWFVSCCPC